MNESRLIALFRKLQPLMSRTGQKRWKPQCVDERTWRRWLSGDTKPSGHSAKDVAREIWSELSNTGRPKLQTAVLDTIREVVPDAPCESFNEEAFGGWFFDLAERERAAANQPEQSGLRLCFDHLIKAHTVLFAGREEEQRQILSFIAAGAGGYVFLEGPSGYGKTSLLAKLVRDHPGFAYHFISQAYKTSGSSFDPTELESLLANLCEQLEPESPLPADSRGLLVRFQRLLQSPPQKQPAVLVLDGVDEVDRHPNYLLGLLPRTLPAGVFAVISARTQGDRCYLSEIGLDQKAIGLHLELRGLEEHEIAQLLLNAGGSAAPLAKTRAFVAKLHAISKGDPFYLRFLVEDIASGALTAKNIERTPSALNTYLDQQLSQLDRSAHRPQHRDILGLILEAKGPLSRDDLIRLVDGLDGLNFGDVIRDIHRFLLVHANRYTFCHSRFKTYFASQL